MAVVPTLCSACWRRRPLGMGNSVHVLEASSPSTRWLLGPDLSPAAGSARGRGEGQQRLDTIGLQGSPQLTGKADQEEGSAGDGSQACLRRPWLCTLRSSTTLGLPQTWAPQHSQPAEPAPHQQRKHCRANTWLNPLAFPHPLYLVVVKMAVDGEAVAPDSPLVTRRSHVTTATHPNVTARAHQLWRVFLHRLQAPGV